MRIDWKLPGLAVADAEVVVAPNDIDEGAGAPPTLPNEGNDAVAVGLLFVAFKVPKLVVVAAVVDAGQPPRDVPKLNCGLFKKCTIIYLL